jgi:hypothetical protein
MSGKQPADESLVFSVAVEVEKGKPVVAVDADMFAREDLEAPARVPSKLGGGDARITGVVD